LPQWRTDFTTNGLGAAVDSGRSIGVDERG